MSVDQTATTRTTREPVRRSAGGCRSVGYVAGAAWLGAALLFAYWLFSSSAAEGEQAGSTGAATLPHNGVAPPALPAAASPVRPPAPPRLPFLAPKGQAVTVTITAALSQGKPRIETASVQVHWAGLPAAQPRTPSCAREGGSRPVPETAVESSDSTEPSLVVRIELRPQRQPGHPRP